MYIYMYMYMAVPILACFEIEVAQATGVVLDPVYSGKAALGMLLSYFCAA